MRNNIGTDLEPCSPEDPQCLGWLKQEGGQIDTWNNGGTPVKKKSSQASQTS